MSNNHPAPPATLLIPDFHNAATSIRSIAERDNFTPRFGPIDQDPHSPDSLLCFNTKERRFEGPLIYLPLMQEFPPRDNNNKTLPDLTGSSLTLLPCSDLPGADNSGTNIHRFPFVSFDTRPEPVQPGDIAADFAFIHGQTNILDFMYWHKINNLDNPVWHTAKTLTDLAAHYDRLDNTIKTAPDYNSIAPRNNPRYAFSHIRTHERTTTNSIFRPASIKETITLDETISRNEAEDNFRYHHNRKTLLALRKHLLIRYEYLYDNMKYNCIYDEITPKEFIRRWYHGPRIRGGWTKIETSPHIMSLLKPEILK